MEQQRDTPGMLTLVSGPAFTVKDNKIIQLNPAAGALLLKEGMDIAPLLATGAEEYSRFQGGCLYLTLQWKGSRLGASVTRMAAGDVFLLEQEEQNRELSALALAARELRMPLTNVLMTIQSIYPDAQTEDAARVNRGLYQLMRILGNMADAESYLASTRQETVNLTAFLQEILENAKNHLAQQGLTLQIQAPEEPLYCLADRDQLERAVLNILSNAAKFTPEGGLIRAEIRRKGRLLMLSVEDSGKGIAPELMPTLFSRYLRQPGLEDSRFGIGLGMVLVRSVASHHGGAVLIDSPKGSGTRVTMTLSIRQSDENSLRCPTLMVAYSGGWDRALTELSERLPPQLYTPEF